MFRMFMRLTWAIVIMSLCNVCCQADEGVLTYQGKLIEPLVDRIEDGQYDMVFEFYDSSEKGTVLLTDEHTLASGFPVTVANGFYTVKLGGGLLSDGPDPPEYTALDQLFADHSDLWMAVSIEGETLLPRRQLSSQAYSFDSARLDGFEPSAFSDGSSLNSENGELTDVMCVDDEGDVGVGTCQPSQRLHIVGQGDSAGLIIEAASGTTARCRFAGGSIRWNFNVSGDNVFRISEGGGDDRLTILRGTGLGVGTTNSTAALCVLDDLHIAGALYNASGDPGLAGQILSSTGSGIIWNDIGSFVDSDWTIDSSDIYCPAGVKVGIGVSDPTHTLMLVGPESGVVGDGSLFVMASDDNTDRFGFRIGDTGNYNLYLDSYDSTWRTQLMLNRNSGKLGIGTDTPQNRLDVAGNAAVGSTYAGVYSAPDNGLLIENKLGIGDTNPSQTVRVAQGDIRLDQGKILWYANAELSSNLKLKFRSNHGIGIEDNGIMFYSAYNAHSFRDASGVNERMRLETGATGHLAVLGSGKSYFAGKLGIGADPVNRLDVAGGVAVGTAFAGVEPVYSDCMLVQGDVGVGVESPSMRMTVRGDGVCVTNDSLEARTRFYVGTDDVGILRTYGSNGNLNTHFGQADSLLACGSFKIYDSAGDWKFSAVADEAIRGRGYFYTRGENGNHNNLFSSVGTNNDHGKITVHNLGGTAKAKMYVNDSGSGYIEADLISFRTIYPKDNQKTLWYSTIGGPEAGVYVRGTAKLIDGEAVLDLPDHFKAVAEDGSMTVFLTPQSLESLGLAVVDKSFNGIVVRELHQGTGAYPFNWEVMCRRKNSGQIPVISAKPPDDLILEVPPATQTIVSAPGRKIK